MDLEELLEKLDIIGIPPGMPTGPHLEPGTRVVKATYAPGDGHQIGAMATVHASIPLHGDAVGYWVYWDDVPKIRCFVICLKVRRVDQRG